MEREREARGKNSSTEDNAPPTIASKLQIAATAF